MIFLDSWVWLEFLLGGDRDDAAEELIERASDDGGLIAPTVIAEVSYRLRAVRDEPTAVEAVGAIRDFERIRCPPLVDEVGEYAAALRFDYYDRGERELSYADAIHLATAAIHDGCHTLYSGDPDFSGLEIDGLEIEVL